MPDTRLAVALGVVGFLSALLYVFSTPLWQAPDEPSHLGYIEYVDRSGSLPSPLKAKVPAAVQARARQNLKWPQLSTPLPTEPKVLAAEEFAYRDLMYTANHPPLYYISARPFARIGAGLAGNRLEGLAYGARVFSALLVGVTIALSFLCARLLDFSRSNSLLVSSLIVLQPQYLFIGASVNNDALTVALWSAFVYVMLREIRSPHRGHQFLVGLLVGLGLLTKITFFLAVPLTIIGFRLAADHRSRGEANHRATIAIILSFLISGWWFLANFLRYGSFWYVIGGSGLGPASLREFFTLSQFYRWLFKSYWGFFGWMEKPLPTYFYVTFLGLCILAIVGTLLTFARSDLTRNYRRSLLFLLATSGFLLAGAIMFRIVAQTGQGRYLFPAIIPSTLILWIGLRFWVADRYKGWLAHATLALFVATSGVGLMLIRQL